MNTQKRYALVSVADKSQVVELCEALVENGFTILSTGGTQKVLKQAKIPVVPVFKITGFPELLDGRVKTLHPLIHAALLGNWRNLQHQKELVAHSVPQIDLLVVNLYPFEKISQLKGVTHEKVLANIDIGGSTMLRAAAKNYQNVISVCDPKDYKFVKKQLKINARLTLTKAIRAELAAKVFRHTAFYDALIAEHFNKFTAVKTPEVVTLPLRKKAKLRYGENPHQQASFYQTTNHSGTITDAKLLQGKQLSFNNVQDANAAIQVVKEFKNLVVVGLKHCNPCGVGIGKTVTSAWLKAFAGDPVSIFGGIVATNAKVTLACAKAMNKVFLEIVVAPDFTNKALQEFARKPNLRLLALKILKTQEQWQYVHIPGGVLRQEWDTKNVEDAAWEVVSKKKPTQKEKNDLCFGQKIVKHVKSNAIVLVKNQTLIGVGAGQMNRITAAQIAFYTAGKKAKGAVLASDAFFPFPDVVKLAVKKGVTAVIQPGGSIRDSASVKVSDEGKIVMVMTKMRHFKH